MSFVGDHEKNFYWYNIKHRTLHINNGLLVKIPLKDFLAVMGVGG